MNPTLAALMVARDAGEQGDEETRVRILDELVEIAHRERIGRFYEDEWVGHVTCSWCKSRHMMIMNGPTQGVDCCAHVFERDGQWWLAGGYGSTVADMTLFKFVKKPPREPANPVCDACIRVLLSSGDLVEERELEPSAGFFEVPYSDLI